MLSVAIIGSRGYPSYYGGFETAVRKLAPYLADHGWDVTVYGRRAAIRPGDPEADPRVQSRLTRGFEQRSTSTISYGLTASMDAARRGPDVALVMNVANGFFLPILRARGIPTLMNVDGIEWERQKWGRVARSMFRTGARMTARHATRLVFDAEAIGDYWGRVYDRDGAFIPYGGDFPPPLPVPLGLVDRKYVLLVARFVPENTIVEFFDAVPEIAQTTDVVIVGSSGYGGELDESAGALAEQNSRVRWLGHVSDDALLLALWQHAGAYFHGHSVGGTNPALVQGMAAGAPTVARDTVYNREVLGNAGVFVDPAPKAIAKAVLDLVDDEARQSRASSTARERAASAYSWELVNSRYERELRALVEKRGAR